MAETVFEFVAGALEQASDLDKLEARGTLRIALKQAGLDAKHVSPDQMGVVLSRVLPDQLASRGVGSAEAICQGLTTRLEGFSTGAAPASESPEDVFRRLGGR
jgi:hypothetical protein